MPYHILTYGNVSQHNQKAARAAKALLLVATKGMRHLLSKLYAQIFLFFRDIMEWYMMSRTYRLLSSFNENLQKRYEKAVTYIDSTIMDMSSELNLAQYAQYLEQPHEERRAKN
jgi:hypothetical protein